MKPEAPKEAANKPVRGVKWNTCQHYSSEEKIRNVSARIRSAKSIAAQSRRDGIAECRLL